MRKMITILQVTIENNKLVLTSDFKHISEITPKGQMLVDSDRLAFIYIIEHENEYVWLSLPQELWEKVNEGRLDHLQVVLQNNKTYIELPNYMEELDYLIENIKDNGNYGDEMVTLVEKVFLQEV